MKRIIPAITIPFAAIAAFAVPASAGRDDHELALAECPGAVQATIIQAARNGALDEIELVHFADGDLYVAEVDLPDRRDLEVYVAADGRLVRTEEEIAWTELPARVQATLSQQAGNMAEIEDITRNTSGRTVTFSAEIDVPGKGMPEIDVEVATDGRLLSAVEEIARASKRAPVLGAGAPGNGPGLGRLIGASTPSSSPLLLD
jgi:hypothetical protein